MKKTMCLLIAVLFLFGTAACGGSKLHDDSYLDRFENTPDDGKPSWEYDNTEYEFSCF